MADADPPPPKPKTSARERDAFRNPVASLNDYDRWVFVRLAEERGDAPGGVAGWIIDDWILNHRDFLADHYGITRDAYHLHRSRERTDTEGIAKGES